MSFIHGSDFATSIHGVQLHKIPWHQIPRCHVEPLISAFDTALRCQIPSQRLDRVRSLRLFVPTEETVDGLLCTEHRKIHPMKLEGFNQDCELHHDCHRLPNSLAPVPFQQQVSLWCGLHPSQFHIKFELPSYPL